MRAVSTRTASQPRSNSSCSPHSDYFLFIFSIVVNFSPGLPLKILQIGSFCIEGNISYYFLSIFVKVKFLDLYILLASFGVT